MPAIQKRTSNSVTVEMNSDDTNWQQVTIGGSVIFQWKVEQRRFLIRFSKKMSSDTLKYIVTYTHWTELNGKGENTICASADMTIYYVGESYNWKNVTVAISTGPSTSPCTIMYDDTELTALVLRGEDGSVNFHKVIVSAHSPVFKTMMAGEWKETSEGVIDIPGTSKETLQHLKNYMYLGKLPNEQNCLKELLLLSSCYLMEDLRLRCIKELRFILSAENVIDYILFAIENKNKQLLVEILDCAETGDLNVNNVRELLNAEVVSADSASI